jgi:hypothetical protein
VVKDLQKVCYFAKLIFICNVSNIVTTLKLYSGFDFMEITDEELELGFFFILYGDIHGWLADHRTKLMVA